MVALMVATMVWGPPTTEGTREMARGTLTEDHKAKLAIGRDQGRVVARYLDALDARRRGRRPSRRTPERLRARLEVVEQELRGPADVLTRLRLRQARLDLTEALASGEDPVPPLEDLEGAFVVVAADYSRRKGLSRAAWRCVGVPSAVLDRAGIH